MKPVRALFSNLLVPLALAAALFLLLEGGCRAALRVRTGAWPETRVTAYTKFVEKIGKAYRPHPLLIVAGRPDAVLEAAGHVVHFNARGQRATNVRDLSLPKPPGVFRIVCEGGSTTCAWSWRSSARTKAVLRGDAMSGRHLRVSRAGGRT